MILKPQNREELSMQLAEAWAQSQKISRVELSALDALVEHFPEDMTATVEAGMTLSNFQTSLHRCGQWLPIDPPNPDTLTIGDLLALDLSGPRRFGYGTVRDYVLGIKVALADGQIIKAGGKVVKNVAGYDLCKLFIGARHSLGVIIEATFKLRPLFEAESFIHTRADSFGQLHNLSRALLTSGAEPVVLDAHNLDGPLSLVAAFAGVREDVEAQLAIAVSLGFSPMESPPYLATFWREPFAHKLSVLPSTCAQKISELDASEFLAHLGNGVIHYRGGQPPLPPNLPKVLMDRVKNIYDQRHILPPYSA